MNNTSNISRRLFLKMSGGALASVAAGVQLSSCGTQRTDTKRVICVLNPDDEPDAGFDPLFGWGCGDVPHAPIIQSSLVKLGPSFDIEPDVASEWSWSDDRLTLHMNLRDDVHFSDGTPVTASDVKFTLDQACQSDKVHVDLSMISSVDAIDDVTVDIQLSHPSHIVPFSLCFVGIVPADSYDEISYGANPIGSGPYQISNWDHGSRIDFKANPYYYGDVSVQDLSVLFRGEDEACGLCYNNSVDMSWTSPRLSDQSITDFSLVDTTSVDVYGISLPMAKANSTRTLRDENRVPCGNDITSDQAIRQALCLGIDRKNLIKNELQGYGVIAFSPVANTPWNNSDIVIQNTDTAAATQILDQAGWAVGSDGFRSKGGKRAAMTLYCPADMHSMKSPTERQVAKGFVSGAKKLGIDITLAYADAQTMEAQRYINPCVCQWHSGLPYELRRAFASSSDANDAGYTSQTTDAYLQEAQQAEDIDGAIRAWRKAQWDGSVGPCAQGSAAYAVMCTSDQVFFKRASLDVGIHGRHTTQSGWSMLANAHTWVWNQ